MILATVKAEIADYQRRCALETVRQHIVAGQEQALYEMTINELMDELEKKGSADAELLVSRIERLVCKAVDILSEEKT